MSLSHRAADPLLIQLPRFSRDPGSQAAETAPNSVQPKDRTEFDCKATHVSICHQSLQRARNKFGSHLHHFKQCCLEIMMDLSTKHFVFYLQDLVPLEDSIKSDWVQQVISYRRIFIK